MSKKNDGGAAFPRTPSLSTNGQEGMSLRDYFAAQFSAGLIAFKVGEKMAALFETPESRANQTLEDYQVRARAGAWIETRTMGSDNINHLRSF